ncbi:MAG: recombinase RmuC [Coxiella sp. RIFCSPHIGHO2_12_FULL_44_14]|nr:MAG: recombinase RmuC [Coxiella sp. RIFCSPHIGHO2_12_FULL_44_14]
MFVAGILLWIWLSRWRQQQSQSQQAEAQQLLLIQERLQQLNTQREALLDFTQQQQQAQQEQRERFDQHQMASLKLIQETLIQGLQEVRQQTTHLLNQQLETLGQRMDKLTEETRRRLQEISGQVERRLSEGFEKTTATFASVIQRLTIIDEAQKKITELSSNVVSLQEILADKRSRGAFGEVQLNSLIRNMLPEAHFSLQHTLSNGKRPDCILFLPEPTGNIVIDAKFPLESYQQMYNPQCPPESRPQAEKQFQQDIRKHIQDIAEKYIIPGETAEGAVMFVPAEAVFAEIHAHHPDLIEMAHKARVWLVSPTTLMAILTTARAVLKDSATRKQVHIIQEHLIALNKDFERFQERMDHLAKHITQAHQDVEEVHQSSRKISSRFSKIEKVELGLENQNAAVLPE